MARGSLQGAADPCLALLNTCSFFALAAECLLDVSRDSGAPSASSASRYSCCRRGARPHPIDSLTVDCALEGRRMSSYCQNCMRRYYPTMGIAVCDSSRAKDAVAVLLVVLQATFDVVANKVLGEQSTWRTKYLANKVLELWNCSCVPMFRPINAGRKKVDA